MIIVETSALVAILEGEPEAANFASLINQSGRALIIAPAILEASIVLSRRHGERAAEVLSAFIDEAGIEIAPFDGALAKEASAAYIRYGKGRHPAGLNFGDCMAYALAKQLDAPLLFKGNDFPQTDVRTAG